MRPPILAAPTPWVLQKIPHQKYVLHGSPLPLSVVDPRQAYCGGERQETNQFAVYGTLLIDVAVVHAIIRRNRGRNRFAWWLNTNNVRFQMYAQNVSLQTGYVHVLPREYFRVTWGGLLCLSEKPVPAVKIYRVEPGILNLLPKLDWEICPLSRRGRRFLR